MRSIRELSFLEQLAGLSVGAGLLAAAIGGSLSYVESFKIDEYAKLRDEKNVQIYCDKKRVYNAIARGGLITTIAGTAAYGASLIAKGLKKE